MNARGRAMGGEPKPHCDSWDDVVDAMLDDLRRHEARADAYWAQQLAFGPVLVHALGLRLRRGLLDQHAIVNVRRTIATALEMLAELPEPRGGDPASLAILAARQARALSSGRRSYLRKLGLRVGLSAQEIHARAASAGPLRMYPLLGWRPSGSER